MLMWRNLTSGRNLSSYSNLKTFMGLGGAFFTLMGEIIVNKIGNKREEVNGVIVI